EYASVNELILIVKAMSVSIITTIVLVSVLTSTPPFLRLYFITWMMHLLLIGGSRLSWRIIRRQFLSDKETVKIPTLIVGAGRGGSLLIRQMLTTPYMGMEPVTVVDDDLNKQGDRKSTRLNSSHVSISYAVFCLKKKK